MNQLREASRGHDLDLSSDQLGIHLLRIFVSCCRCVSASKTMQRNALQLCPNFLVVAYSYQNRETGLTS